MQSAPDTLSPPAVTPPAADEVAALQIRALDKFFGDFQALHDINLDIHRGEFVCFLGPSGCGKTTLLRAIAGLDRQDKGSIHQNGADISQAPVAARDFGIVFQSYALFPNLTVERNIGYGLRGLGMSRAQRKARVTELLEMVNLTTHERKYPSEISGGQQQRVALARALAPSPQLLLLDEPLSALDAQVRLHLRAQLRQLQRELGVTTVMVTHDQDEALSLADRIVVMRAGVIEQIGVPEEIFIRPASPFVAGFLGDMNFVEGVITADGMAEVAGAKLVLPAGATSAPGSNVRIGIRPTDIEVTTEMTTGSGSIAGVIESVAFRGNSHMLWARCQGSDVVLHIELTRNAWHGLGLDEGGKINLTLPADTLHVFPQGPAQG